jgi:hypothetical protein
MLYAGSGGVVLQVEQVLHVLGHHSHHDAEAGALEVRHGLKMLLPYVVLLIPNQSGEAR